MSCRQKIIGLRGLRSFLDQFLQRFDRSGGAAFANLEFGEQQHRRLELRIELDRVAQPVFRALGGISRVHFAGVFGREQISAGKLIADQCIARKRIAQEFQFADRLGCIALSRADECILIDRLEVGRVLRQNVLDARSTVLFLLFSACDLQKSYARRQILGQFLVDVLQHRLCLRGSSRSKLKIDISHPDGRIGGSKVRRGLEFLICGLEVVVAPVQHSQCHVSRAGFGIEFEGLLEFCFGARFFAFSEA